MDVVSYCRIRVSSLLWQPRHDAFALTVICKATFELRPGECPLASAQEPLWDAHAPVSDFVPFKRRADVLVMGRAYPPNTTTTSVLARVGVGRWQKAVEARAEQQWLVEGVAPILPTAPSRMSLLGKHASNWNHHTWNTKALPQDVDGAFFNSAPMDQQLVEFVGDESLVLEHLHPGHARLETKFIPVMPNVVAQRGGGQAQDVRMRCDTLIIDTEKLVGMLVWRGAIILAHENEPGIVLVTADGAGGDADATSTIMLPAEAHTKVVAPVLPFAQDKPSVPNAFVSNDDGPTLTPPLSRDDDDATGTHLLWYAGVATTLKPVTPFEQRVREDKPTVHEVAKVETTALPFLVAPPPLLEVLPPPTAPVIEEPPLIGPLTRVDKPLEDKTIPKDKPHEEVGEVEQGAQVSASVLPVIEPEPESVVLTLEQVALIAAELAEGKKDRRQVFEAHRLRERSWRKNEKHWSESIATQSARGTHALQAAYDAAYVARVEAFRGPIQLEEYARIVVALERGQAFEVLAELKIHRAALMPIVRLRTQKVAKDMKLGDAANGVLRALRRA